MIRVNSTRNPFDPLARLSHFEAPNGRATLGAVMPSWAKGNAQVRAWVNGVPVAEPATPLRDGDVVDVLELPADFGLTASAVAFASVGAAKAVTAFSFAGLFKLAGIFGLNFIVGQLLAPSRQPVNPGDESSPTYRFGGINTNPDAEGAPVPVVLGSMRTGGVVIGRYTSSTLTGTDLFTLLLLSEGQVRSIGGLTSDAGPLTSSGNNLPAGLEINGQPAENYDGLEVHVRMGGLNQDPIPGFEASSKVEPVEQTLSDSSTPGPGLVTLAAKDGGYNPAVTSDQDELDKWDTAVAFTMPEEADEFVALISFPQGLYQSTPTGGIVANSAEFQVRYQEVDGTGTPIGNVLVLPPEAVVSQSQTSPFELEFRHPFFDVDSYEAPTNGYYLELSGINGYASIPSPSGVLDLPNDEVEWTLSTWVRVPVPTSTTPVRYDLFSWLNTGTNRGVRFFIELSTQTLRLNVQLGIGSSITTISGSSNPTGTPLVVPTQAILNQVWSEWQHFAVTYKASDGGVGAGKLRTYWNGALLGVTDFTGLPHNLAQVGPVLIGAFGGGGPFANADFDATKFFQRKLETAEILSQYNEGNGFGGTGAEPDLLFALLFDETIAGSPATTPDASPNSNAAQLLAGATVTTGTDFGVVQGAGGGAYKRGRYRIQIQRLDTEETDPLEQNTAEWTTARLITWADFRYPGRALIGIRQRATDQLNGGAPTYTIPVEGPRAPIWDGASTQFPVAPLQFTRNPAWLAVLVATDKKWGLGDRYSLTDLDLPAFKEWADWCDELVPDGLESVDIADVTSASLAYNDTFQQVTITITGIDFFPDRWVAGYSIRIDVGDAEWDTPAGEGLEIVSAVYTSASSSLVVVAEWSPNMAEPDPTTLNPTSGTVRGVEERMRCDLVLDRRQDAAPDVLDRIFSAGRAQRIQVGSRLSVFVDKPEPPAALVTHATVVEGTLQTTYQSIADRPNVVEAEILDRDDGFRSVRLEREHPTIQDPAEFNGRRVRRIALEGVTRRSQAMRELLYQLNVFHLVRRNVQFELPHIGIDRRVGDVVQVSHDVPQWGYSGKVRQAGVQAGLIQVSGKSAGMNVAFIKDFESLAGIFRSNLFTGARGWVSEDATGPKTGTNQNSIPINTNAEAMPNSVAPGQRIATLLFRDVITPNVDSAPLPVYRAGRYIVTYTEGTLNLSVGFDASNLIALPGNRFSFDVNAPSSAGIHFAITACNNVRGLRLFHEDDEPYIDAEPWDPAFVAEMGPVSEIRWMESNDVNNDYENGPPNPPGYLFWNRHGPPIEWMCDFSNRYGKRPWFCIPTYYFAVNRRLYANRVFDALDPSISPIFERANEYFNFIPYQDPPGSGNWLLGPLAPATHCFTVANDLQPHPTLANTFVIGPGAIDADPFVAHWKQWGRFAEEQIVEIETNSKFAGTTREREHVLGAQYVQANETAPGSGVFVGLTKTAMDECPSCDSVAGAPYNPGGPFDPAYDVDTQTADQILTAMEANQASVFAEMTEFASLVQQEGKKVRWYEIGQQLVGGNPANNQVLIDCQQDPRMGAIILGLLNKAEELEPGSAPCAYSSHTKGGSEGQFGYWRYPGQPITEAPKAQALYEFIGTNTGGGPDPPDPPEGEVNVSLFLDREVVLSGNDEIVIQSATAGDRITLTVVTEAGTIPADTLIVARGVLGDFVPSIGDQYAIGPVTKATKSFRLTSTEIDARTLVRRCSGPEYNAAIYDDDFGDLDPPTSLLPAPSIALLTSSIPETAQALEAADATRDTSSGSIVPEVVLTWSFEPDTLPAVDAVEVYASNSITTPRRVRKLSGRPRAVTLGLDGLDPDKPIWVWVRPVNARGEGRPIRSSARTGFELLGLVPAPLAPTSLAETASGQEVLYGWASTESRRVAGFEVRRGGWILGQRLGTTGPGGVEIGPSFQFGSFSDDLDANGAYPMQVRAFRGNRQFGPAGSRATLSTPPNEVLYELHLQDDGATGWEGATLTGFTRDVSATGTGLTADGLTSAPNVNFTLPALRQAEECVLIVCWEAEQVYPNLGTDDGTPLGSRWTSEGPLWTYDGEISNATVRCAASYSTTATAPSSPTIGYRANPVTMRRARVLLRFSRSDLSVGIKLKRMYVALLRTNKPRLDHAEIAFLL